MKMELLKIHVTNVIKQKNKVYKGYIETEKLMQERRLDYWNYDDVATRKLWENLNPKLSPLQNLLLKVIRKCWSSINQSLRTQKQPTGNSTKSPNVKSLMLI